MNGMKRMKNFKIGIIAALSLNYVHCNMPCSDLCFTSLENVNEVPMNQNDKKILKDNENKIGYGNGEENEDGNSENDPLSHINKYSNTDNEGRQMYDSDIKRSTYTDYKSRSSNASTGSSTTYNDRHGAKTEYREPFKSGINPSITQKDIFNYNEIKDDDIKSKTDCRKPKLNSGMIPDNSYGETQTDDELRKTPTGEGDTTDDESGKEPTSDYYEKNPYEKTGITPDGCSKNDDINQYADNSKS